MNFLGEDQKLGPICVSVVKEKKDEKPPYGRYRVLIWTKEVKSIKISQTPNTKHQTPNQKGLLFTFHAVSFTWLSERRDIVRAYFFKAIARKQFNLGP